MVDSGYMAQRAFSARISDPPPAEMTGIFRTQGHAPPSAVDIDLRGVSTRGIIYKACSEEVVTTENLSALVEPTSRATWETQYTKQKKGDVDVRVTELDRMIPIGNPQGAIGQNIGRFSPVQSRDTYKS